MAIASVLRGDLVAAVQPGAVKTGYWDTGKGSQGAVAGLFVVDSVNGDFATVFPLSNLGEVVAGANKGDALNLRISTDIFAVYRANSISA